MKPQFITDSQVSTHLRAAAVAALGLPPSSSELALWSTHSIRVTAANLLHRQRFTDSFIQIRLRWRSNSFRDYLRNTFYAADKHSALDVSASNLPPRRERRYRALEAHETLAACAA